MVALALARMPAHRRMGIGRPISRSTLASSPNRGRQSCRLRSGYDRDAIGTERDAPCDVMYSAK
jgi:hypothetical protein